MLPKAPPLSTTRREMTEEWRRGRNLLFNSCFINFISYGCLRVGKHNYIRLQKLMDNAAAFKIVSDEYANTAFTINNDLQLWQVLLPEALKTYLEKYPQQIEFMSSALGAYDINNSDGKVWHKFFNRTYEVNVNDLESNKRKFFHWVQVLSLVRLYNSIEDLLIHSIQVKFFDTLSISLKNRSQVNLIKSNIQKELESNNIKVSRNNNKYIIDFLKLKSIGTAKFLQCKTYSIPQSSWEEFFEFISIIRHLIVHNGMLVSTDEKNKINSKYKGLFELYFQLEEREDGLSVININENTGIGNIINLCNDFAFNAAKFIFGFDSFPFMSVEGL